MSRTADGPSVDRTAIERTRIEAMVSSIAPRWRVERVRPSEEGSDYVFFLDVETPGGPREVVLKAFSGAIVPPTVARAEPRLLELLGAETTIPVPDVVGSVVEHQDHPTPYFLAESLPGENGADRFDDLSTATLERILADAGRHLAELHSLRTWDAFGRIGVTDGTLSVVDGESNGYERWTDWLLQDVEATLDGLAGSRFEDLLAPLRAYLREEIPALDPIDSGVLVHWDYRLGNLLIDADAGRTTGVVDWVDLIAGDPIYNLVTVVDHNVNWQTEDVVLRRRLRNAFFDAYAEHSSGEPLADVHERRRLYHLCHRLNAMACLPEWYADAPESTVEERATIHRAFVREYID